MEKVVELNLSSLCNFNWMHLLMLPCFTQAIASHHIPFEEYKLKQVKKSNKSIG